MGPAPAVARTRTAVRRHLAAAAHGVVAVAVSGGTDSLALLAALAFEAPRAGCTPVALTVDHGLRPGSAAQAARVAAQATALGVRRTEVLAVRVRPAGDGPEAAARRARYAALEAAAQRVGAVAVLLGHTRDDQAETVLLGLARGSGARSLAGMPEATGCYRRPFLDLPRETLVLACRAQGLAPWDDPMNADPSYARVRARRDVLPALERALGPGVAAALARTARLLRADADALDAWAERERPAATRPDGGLDVAALAALPVAVRSRVLRAAALAAGVPGGLLTAVHLTELDRLVVDWHGQGAVALPGAHLAVRRCGTIRVDPGGRADGRTGRDA